MYRLDNVIEKWAADFKLISHDPDGGAEGKRFFRIDSISKLKPLILSLTRVSTPVVAYCTEIQGNGNEKGPGTYYGVDIFILTPQEKVREPYREDIAAAEAKYLAVEISEKLRAWLMEKKREGNEYPELKGLDLKGFAVASFPQKLGDWWPLHIVLDYLNTDYQCVLPDDYHSGDTSFTASGRKGVRP